MLLTSLVVAVVWLPLIVALRVHNAARTVHPLWHKQAVYHLDDDHLLVSLKGAPVPSTAAVLDATHVCHVGNCSWIQPSSGCIATAAAQCFGVNMPSKGVHSLAFYHLGNATHHLVGNRPILINATQVSPATIATFVNSNKPFQVGSYWTPYFTPTTLAALNRSKELGRPAPNLETWIRSNGTLSADDVQPTRALRHIKLTALPLVLDPWWTSWS